MHETFAFQLPFLYPSPEIPARNIDLHLPVPLRKFAGKMRGHFWFGNDDIPMNILSRLSTKKVHLLKLVSRDWLDLLSQRSFIALQLKKSEPVSGFFFQEVFEWTDDEGVESISYIPVGMNRVNVSRDVFDFLPDHVVILSINNGLCCCRSSYPNPEPMIFVCNPLNKQWRSLMWPDRVRKDCSIALAFDPFEDPVNVSTDFNLVAVSRVREEIQVSDVEEEDDYIEEEFSFFFDVYSTKTRSWRRLKESFKSNRVHDLSKNRGVLVNGILYWLTDGYGVLMFDHKTEMFWLIECPLPRSEFACIPEMCIGESEGKLHYVIISEHGLQVYVLDDYLASKWDLKFYAALDELERENPTVIYNLEEKIRSQFSREAPSYMDPLSFKDGVMLLRVSSGVYLYQFDARRMTKLCDVLTLGPKSMYSPIVAAYTMSLVPVEQA